MTFLYYFNSCPTCKNQERNIVREAGLVAHEQVIERYIPVLPQVWGEEARGIIAQSPEENKVELPFIWCVETQKALHVDASDEQMLNKAVAFLGFEYYSKEE